MGWEVARAGTGGLSWRLLSAERGVEEWVSLSGKMANLMSKLE